MKENCDWKKCLDRIEDKGFDDDDAYSEILEYIREVATVDEKREVLQNVEQRVKKIVNYDFAKAFGIDIIQVIKGGDISKEAYTGDGEMINSEFLNGFTNKKDSIARMVEEIKKMGVGEAGVQF